MTALTGEVVDSTPPGAVPVDSSSPPDATLPEIVVTASPLPNWWLIAIGAAILALLTMAHDDHADSQY